MKGPTAQAASKLNSLKDGIFGGKTKVHCQTAKFTEMLPECHFMCKQKRLVFSIES